VLETSDTRIVSGILIAGFVVFLIGAVRWQLAYQAPFRESLAAIAASPGRWQWIHIWMIGGVLLTILGLAGLTPLFFSAGGHVSSVFGVVLFAIGGILWLPGVVWRLTVLQAGAMQGPEDVPSDLEAWGGWFGYLHTIHLLLAYASWVALGAAVLDTDIVAGWVGWLGIGLGFGGVLGYLAFRGGPFAAPIFAHFYPLVLGIALWLR
jgi:hypothetical protein